MAIRTKSKTLAPVMDGYTGTDHAIQSVEGSEGSRGSIEYWGNVNAIEDIIEDFMQNKLTLGE